MQEITIKSYPKLNISLKVFRKHSNGLHPLESRFTLVLGRLYDVLHFKILDSKDNMKNVPFKDNLYLTGNFNCNIESNLIYKAFKALCEASNTKSNENILINVTKNIKVGGGLGGGSSNAAVSLLALNELLHLNLSKKKLLNIAQNLGSDVAFFLIVYSQDTNKLAECFKSEVIESKIFLSANVRGFGEIIEPFFEKHLHFNIYTNDIFCDTAAVYKRFDALQDYIIESKIDLNLDSKSILKNFDIFTLNDLYRPATLIYPRLLDIQKKLQDSINLNIYFSGSGSSFFSMT